MVHNSHFPHSDHCPSTGQGVLSQEVTFVADPAQFLPPRSGGWLLHFFVASLTSISTRSVAWLPFLPFGPFPIHWTLCIVAFSGASLTDGRREARKRRPSGLAVPPELAGPYSSQGCILNLVLVLFTAYLAQFQVLRQSSPLQLVFVLLSHLLIYVSMVLPNLAPWQSIPNFPLKN